MDVNKFYDSAAPMSDKRYLLSLGGEKHLFFFRL